MFIEDKNRYTPIDYRTVCRDAAQYIEEHGWCQNHWRWGTEVCIEGALGSVGHGDLFIQARKAVRAAVYPLGVTLTEWNDAPERTKEDVLALLRQVAYL